MNTADLFGADVELEDDRIIYTPDKTMLESIYQADYTGDPDSAHLCATHTERGIAIRALGHSGEEIFDAFQNIAEKIRT